MNALRATVLAWLLILSGCGYGTTRLLPAEYQTLHVQPFQNRIPITEEVSDRVGLMTNVPELEEKVTQGVIDRFLFDGNLRVTSDPAGADLILTGEILDFYRQPIRRKDDETVEEYRLNLSSTLTLQDRKGKYLLQGQVLVADATYFVSGGSAVSETTAVDNLVTDYARRVVETVIEYW